MALRCNSDFRCVLGRETRTAGLKSREPFVNYLRSPSVIFLQPLENNNGVTRLGKEPASQAFSPVRYDGGLETLRDRDPKT